MSVSDAEYAMLSNAVYHDENFIEPADYGFAYLTEGGDSTTGFYGEVYQRGNDLVIVFRGSDNKLNYKHDYNWWKDGTQPPELNSAWNFYNEVKKKPEYQGLSISMTGHSLGGAAVQYVNARLTCEQNYQVLGVTFAPAGAGDFFPGLDPSSIAVKNYVRDGDKVPGVMNKHLGYKMVILPSKYEAYEVRYNNGIGEIVSNLSSKGDLLAQHSMLGYWVDVGHLPTRTRIGEIGANANKARLEGEFLRPSCQILSYFQLPEQQSQEMQAMADLERHSVDFKIRRDNQIPDITLQIGAWSYNTEPITSTDKTGELA